MNREIWDQVKSRLNKKNNNKPVVMGLLDGMSPQESKESSLGVLELEFLVQSNYHKEKIDTAIIPQLRKELSCFYKKPFGLNVIVDESKKTTRLGSIAKFMQLPLARVGHGPKSSFRNEFTFDSFIVGPNNEFAHAASHRVATHPGETKSNPLFIFGATGLGKTHLLHAIGSYLKETTNKKISCLSAETFLNECVSGIRSRGMHQFRQKYRKDSHVLLIDDIHVLGRGDHAQEEFFHTLNSFFDTKRQVVVTCDKLPRDIDGLKDRIRTRLEGGLIVDIKMPDLETKMAIAEHKANALGIELSDEICRYIAAGSKRSIRELEGCLNKLSCIHDQNNVPITLNKAKKALFLQETSSPLDPSQILNIVSKNFNLELADMKSKSRKRSLVVARGVAMHLIKKHLKLSLKEIGFLLGKRDHTTVLNSVKKTSLLLKTDSEVQTTLNKIEKDIHTLPL